MNEFDLQAPYRKQSTRKRVGIILLTLVLVTAAGAGAWLWQQREINNLKKATPNPPAAVENNPTPETPNSEGVANWAQVFLGPTFLKGDKQVGMSFGLPPAWKAVSCGGGSEALVTYLSSPTKPAAVCGTEQTAAVSISAQVGDVRNAYVYSDATTYKNPRTEKITIDGKAFRLNSGTVEKPIEFGPAKGSILTSYVFFDAKNGITYAASYIDTIADKEDLAAQFKQIIEKTLQVALSATD
jgi:hypothetical protein